MAEFISAIVGLVAIGVQVGNGLQSLIETVKDAPHEFLDLSKEVTDFRIAITRAEEARKHAKVTEAGLENILRNGAETLQQIDGLVRKLVKQNRKCEHDQQINRIKWLASSKKAGKLQQQLRWQRSSICNMLAIENLSSSINIEVSLSELNAKVNSLVAEQQDFKEKQDRVASRLIEAHTTIRHATEHPPVTVISAEQCKRHPASSPARLRNASQVLSKSCSRHMSNEHKLAGSDHFITGSDSRNAVNEVDESGFTSIINSKPSAFGPDKNKLRESLKISRDPRLQCLEGCLCRCHTRVTCRSPRYLSTYLGDMFLGGSSLPWSISSFFQCNEQTCRRTRNLDADIRYYLPQWVLTAVASFNLTFSLRMIPLKVHLQTRNTIPYCSPILECIQVGDINAVRTHLVSGKASLNDVDPYGLGLLYYAAYYCWKASGPEIAMNTCKALLDIGAHAEWEDEIGNTALETMIENVLMTSVMNVDQQHTNPATFQDVAQIFGKCSVDMAEQYFENRSFTPLHKIILGLDDSLGNLELYLSSFAEATPLSEIIDTADSCGRTPLALAVEYGWLAAVRTLLKYGADPCQVRPCVHGGMPLLHLAIAGPGSQEPNFLAVIRILLQAGADINSVDHEGWTPLHVAASWNAHGVIRKLALWGGRQLDWNALTYSGESALDLSFLNGGDQDVTRLLRAQEWSVEEKSETVEAVVKDVSETNNDDDLNAIGIGG